MLRVLVPIEAFARLALSATYFALEFAKRHPAKVYFLILADPGSEAGGEEVASTGRLHEAAVFQQLLARARQQQVKVEVEYSQESFAPAIRRVVAQQGIDHIVLALPPVGDPDHLRWHRRLEGLRHQVGCHIITVKPKESEPPGQAGGPGSSH